MVNGSSSVAGVFLLETNKTVQMQSPGQGESELAGDGDSPLKEHSGFRCLVLALLQSHLKFGVFGAVKPPLTVGIHFIFNKKMLKSGLVGQKEPT